MSAAIGCCGSAQRRRLLVSLIIYASGISSPTKLAASAQLTSLGGCSALERASTGELGIQVYDANTKKSSGFTRVSSSGDPLLDKALPAAAAAIAGVFKFAPNTWPAVILVADNQSALATPITVVDGTQGTILLGKGLVLEEMYKQQYGGAAIEGILAHEFAHHVQFRSSHYQELIAADPNKTVRLVELHADYLAGWYIGQGTSTSVDAVAAFAEALFQRGDDAFRDPSHHGTPIERYAVMLKGFFSGRKGGTQGSLSVSNASNEGAALVRTLI
jgi:hypothetical protein